MSPGRPNLILPYFEKMREVKGKEETVEADYVLVTVGRRPNTEDLGLEQVGIEKDDRGLIKIDKQCRTNIDNIYAIGDIVAGPPLAHKASYEGANMYEELPYNLQEQMEEYKEKESK